MAMLAKTNDTWDVAVSAVPREGRSPTRALGFSEARVSCTHSALQGWADSPTWRRIPSQGNPAPLGSSSAVRGMSLALGIPQSAQTQGKLSGFLRTGLQMGSMTLNVFSNLHSSVMPPVSLTT